MWGVFFYKNYNYTLAMSNYKDFLKDFEKSILRNKRAVEEVELIAVSKKNQKMKYCLLLI